MSTVVIHPAGPGRATLEPLEEFGVAEYVRFRNVCARLRATFDRALDVFTFRLHPGSIASAREIVRSEGLDVCVDSDVKEPAEETAPIFTPKAPVHAAAPSTPRGQTTIVAALPVRKLKQADLFATLDTSTGREIKALARIHATPKVRTLDDLRPYQREGRWWLRRRKRGGLFDDMGLGKTPQALTALPDDASTLRGMVVCPHSLKLNWAEDEGLTWRPDIRYTVLSGSKQFRWPELGEVVVLNYDILPAEFPPPPAGMYLIADEAHALKGGGNRRTKRFKKLHKAVDARNGTTWLLTGTEMPNRPSELYSVLSCASLETEAFGDWPRFVTMFGGKMQTFTNSEGKRQKAGYKWGAIDPQVPERLRTVSLKRMKRDVLKDLPSKTRKWISVDIDDETARICDEVVSHLKLKGIDLDDFHATIDLTKMQGAGFQEMSRACAALALAKTPAMLEVVESYEEQGEPLIVFAAHRGPIDVLAKRPGWMRITGDETAEQRKEAKDRFQRGELKGIAGLYTTMGTGFTLTRGAHMLLVELDWSPLMVVQAEDRACRYGQERGVVINILKANHRLDARRLEVTVEKMELIEATTHAAAVPEGYLVNELTS